jgi:glucosamine--fructose-6-phosphate aminotransferase (isomerizing)
MSEHPMIQNILLLAQPDLWQHSMDLGEKSVGEWLRGRQRDFERVYFVGHGSSLYNGQVGKYLVEHIAGIPAEAIPAFSFASYAETKLLGPKTLVVGISTTGGTKSVVEALARARAEGAPILTITAHDGTPISEGVEATILSGGEADTISVKTSSYVLAIVSIITLALGLAGAGEAVRDEWRQQVREAGAGAANFLTRQRGEIQSLAGTFASASRVFVVGSGPNLGTAGEGALKVIEMAKMHAEAQELEDFFHGRLREVDQVNPMFFIAPGGRTSARVLDLLTVMKHVRSPSVVLTDVITPGIAELATHVIKMPVTLNEFATPLVYIIPLHLFGYEMALVRGYDPNVRRYNIVPQNVCYGDKL